MVDFNPDGAGIDSACLAGVLAFALEFRRGAWAEKAERIQVAFEVSPLAIGIENAFAFGVGAIGRGAINDRAGSLGFRGHKSAGSRIKDAGETQKLQCGERAESKVKGPNPRAQNPRETRLNNFHKKPVETRLGVRELE